MSYRTAARLAVFAFVAALLIGLHPAPFAAAMPEPPEAPPVPPAIDPRPLLDARVADLARYPQTVNLQSVPPAKSRVGAGLAGARPRLMSGGEAPQPAAPTKQAESSFAGCQQLLINPTLDYGTAWSVVMPNVLLDTTNRTTAPNGFRMTEDADGFYTAFGDVITAEVDSFAQLFYFPPTANSLAVDFNMLVHNRGTPGGVGGYLVDPHDEIWFELYLYDPLTGGLGAPIFSSPVLIPGTGSWYTISDSINAVAHPAVISAMQQGQFVWVAISLVGDGFNPAIDVSIDDISLQGCGSTTLPNGTISGSLVNAAIPSDTGAGGQVALTYTPAGGQATTVDVTFANTAGQYSFRRVADPGSGFYQVWFINGGVDGRRIAYWAGPVIRSASQAGVDINISNVNLTKPTSYAEVAFPWTFEWAPRQPPAGTRYLFCIYQLDDATKEGCSSEIFDIKYTISSASNTGLKDGDGANFTLQLNKDYAWYVYALGPGYGSIPDPQKDYGISFYFSVVKFVSAVRELPQNSVTTDPRPLPSAAKKPWTLMVYLAGDSNLGDPVECAGCNPQRGPFLQAHYNTLTRIAQFYPAVHIVVLKDLYGDTGTQFCYLRSDGAEDCRELGELDTSHPDTLRDFVGNARANFPSDRTMLVISDHGHAVTGVAIDETTGWKQGTNEPEAISLTPKEIRSALMSALGGSKLDVLYYNVCLFGSFDAAYDARDFANYMVASADVMWVLDVYDRLLPLLTAANTPRTVASGTVDAYTNTVKSRAPGLFISVAAYDLTKVAAVNNRLSQFAIALSDNLNVSRSDINNRRALLQRFDSTGDLLHRDDDVLVDLRHMASVFANPGFPNIAIRTSAAALLSELNNGLIVKNSQISGGNDAGGTINLSNASSGISVLFPTVTASGPSTALTTSYLVGEGTYSNYFAATQWDDFVALYSGIDRGALLADGRNRPARGGWRPVSGAVSGESTLFHRRFVPRMTN